MQTRLQMLDAHAKPAGAKIKPNVPKQKPWLSVWDGLQLDKEIGEAAVQRRKLIAQKMLEVEPKLATYTDKTAFPSFFLKDMQEVEYAKVWAPKKYGGFGYNALERHASIWEVAKIDTSLTTFLGVHCNLGTASIEACGDDEQKDRFLPDCYSMKKITAFGLTEPKYGSDATSMDTFAVKATDGRDGYILNGEKLWIGNGTFADYIVVWAKNKEDKDKIQAFVVERDFKGFSSTKIEGKYSLRMTQNAHLKFDNVFIPTKNKLTKALNFEKSAGSVLLASRIGVAWFVTALAAGAYENCLKYCLERNQFGRPIASFQLIQERLSRMLANIEASTMLCIHMFKLMDKD